MGILGQDLPPRLRWHLYQKQEKRTSFKGKRRERDKTQRLFFQIEHRRPVTPAGDRFVILWFFLLSPVAALGSSSRKLRQTAGILLKNEIALQTLKNFIIELVRYIQRGQLCHSTRCRITNGCARKDAEPQPWCSCSYPVYKNRARWLQLQAAQWRSCPFHRYQHCRTTTPKNEERRDS